MNGDLLIFELEFLLKEQESHKWISQKPPTLIGVLYLLNNEKMSISSVETTKSYLHDDSQLKNHDGRTYITSYTRMCLKSCDKTLLSFMLYDKRKYAYKLRRFSEPPQSITLPKLLKFRVQNVHINRVQDVHMNEVHNNHKH